MNTDGSTAESKFAYGRVTDILRKRSEAEGIAVIPDIKCKSPAEGQMVSDSDAADLAAELVDAGAPVISVVTENRHYGGSIRLLERISQRTAVPVLRKDFFNCRDLLTESVDAGASAVLLIASMLEQDSLTILACEALKLGLEPLVEVHSLEDIKKVQHLDLLLIGINNRNILELEMDGGTVATTEQLIRFLPADSLVISESSIQCPEDVRRAASAGAGAVLVGTAILKASDPAEMYRSLADAIKRYQ